MAGLLGYVLASTCCNWLLVLAVSGNRLLQDSAPWPANTPLAGDENFYEEGSADAPSFLHGDTGSPYSQCDSLFESEEEENELGSDLQAMDNLVSATVSAANESTSTMSSAPPSSWDASATVSNPHEVMQLLWLPFLPPGCSNQSNQAVDTTHECPGSNLNFTVLLPPERYLGVLDDAARFGAQSHGIVSNITLDSLLLHVLDGRFSRDDLESLADISGTVSTITGHALSVVWGSEERICSDLQPEIKKHKHGCGPQIELSFEASSARIGPNSPEAESCLGESLIFQVSGMLVSTTLSNRIDAYVESFSPSWNTSTRTTVAVEGEGMWSHSKPYVYMLSAGLTVLVCLTVAFAVLFVRRSRRTVGASGAGMAPGGTPPACAAGLVPKELYRLDSHRWSACPRAAVQTDTVSPIRVGYIPQVGNIAQISDSGQRSVQRSTASSGVDTCGSKKAATCLICFEKEGDHALLPCGHGGYCGACAHKLLKQRQRSRQCPICRGELTSVAKVDLNTAVGCAGKVLAASVAEEQATRTQSNHALSAPRWVWSRNLLPGSRDIEDFVARLRSTRRRRDPEGQQRAESAVQDAGGAASAEATTMQQQQQQQQQLQAHPVSINEDEPVSLAGAMAAARTVYL